MENNLKIKLISLIYLLPILVLATYIARDSSSIAVDIVITVGLIALPAAALVGAVHYIKSCDESAKTGVEVFAFFTGAFLAVEVINCLNHVCRVRQVRLLDCSHILNGACRALVDDYYRKNSLLS